MFSCETRHEIATPTSLQGQWENAPVPAAQRGKRYHFYDFAPVASNIWNLLSTNEYRIRLITVCEVFPTVII